MVGLVFVIQNAKGRKHWLIPTRFDRRRRRVGKQNTGFLIWRHIRDLAVFLTTVPLKVTV